MGSFRLNNAPRGIVLFRLISDSQILLLLVSSFFNKTMPSRRHRNTYPLWLKQLVIQWHQDGHTLDEIVARLVEMRYGNIPRSTISTWYSAQGIIRNQQ